MKTPFGKLDKVGCEWSVRATRDELYEWAHRPGASWPCATLRRGVWARFNDDNGALGDLVDTNAGENVDGNEFSAWACDVFALAHNPRNPARV